MSTVIALIIVDYRFFVLSCFIMVTFFLLCFIYLLKRLDKQVKYEKSAYENLISEKDVDVCVVVVVKNEGDTIINTVRHYLAFPEKLQMVVYDDGSKDHSIERLRKIKSNYKKRLEIRSLVKREIYIHPKAFGMEDAFNSIESDIFMVIDADTIINHSDFLKAISALKNETIDILHLARRNDKKNSVIDHIADKEELINLGLYLTKVNDNQFCGSGYLIRSEIAKGLKYDDDITSEDTYLLKFARNKAANIKYFFTLFAHERSPKDYVSIIKQRINWLNQSTPFYFKNFYLLLTIGHILISFSVTGLLLPISFGFVFTSIILSFFLAVQLSISIKILKESFLKTIFYTLLLILNMSLVIWPIHVFLLFKHTFKHSSGKIVKNQ